MDGSDSEDFESVGEGFSNRNVERCSRFGSRATSVRDAHKHVGVENFGDADFIDCHVEVGMRDDTSGCISIDFDDIEIAFSDPKERGVCTSVQGGGCSRIDNGCFRRRLQAWSRVVARDIGVAFERQINQAADRVKQLIVEYDWYRVGAAVLVLIVGSVATVQVHEGYRQGDIATSELAHIHVPNADPHCDGGLAQRPVKSRAYNSSVCVDFSEGVLCGPALYKKAKKT